MTLGSWLRMLADQCAVNACSTAVLAGCLTCGYCACAIIAARSMIAVSPTLEGSNDASIAAL